MRVIHSIEGDVKIHIEDADDYVCNENNGVSFYPSQEQIKTLLDELKDNDTRPASAAPDATFEQIVIEELLAIEGYVNGIYTGDEPPKAMCGHISQSIGVIRHVIREREHLRQSQQERDP